MHQDKLKYPDGSAIVEWVASTLIAASWAALILSYMFVR